MSLDSDFRITTEIAAPQVTALGFGTPMILSVHTKFLERLRYFTSLDGMLDVGFTTSDQEYLDAAGIMAQVIKPPRFAVGRRATAVAQVVTVTVANAVNGTYSIELPLGTGSFVAAGSTTALIATGLAAALTAIAATTGVAAAAVGSTVVLTASTAGIPFTATLTSPSDGLTQAVTTANVGIPEDLAAINDYQPDWYGLLIKERTDAHIMAAAAAIASQDRLFLAQSSSADLLADPYEAGVTTDIGSRLKAAGYLNTSLWYSPASTDALAASMMAYGLARTPSAITWKWKTLPGVTSVRLTETQKTNLLSRSVNGYRPEAGNSITYEGTVASGEFVDNIHGLHKLNSRIQQLAFALQLATPKVPMDNGGIAALGSTVSKALAESAVEGLIGDSRIAADGKVVAPGYEVTLPDITQIAQSDRAARRLPSYAPIRWAAQLRGAIHQGDINGTLSS